jgi:hypothetical protein
MLTKSQRDSIAEVLDWGGAKLKQPQELAVDTEIFREQVQVERKTITFDLRENPRGRFLKITEDVGGRRDAVIIPAPGLADIHGVLSRVIDADTEAGPPQVEDVD